MRKALTVGELLVTMTIIGVIAILVIPGFLKDYHNKVYTTKLKKVYGMLFNAMDQACADNNVTYFNQTAYAKPGEVAKQQEFLDNYLRVSQKNGGSSFAEAYKIINSATNNDGTPITDYLTNTAQAKLQGGETIALMCESQTECIVLIDINGPDIPNIGGRDLFRFRIDTQKNIVMSDSSEEECGNDNVGNGCLDQILEDNWVMKY